MQCRFVNTCPNTSRLEYEVYNVSWIMMIVVSWREVKVCMAIKTYIWLTCILEWYLYCNKILLRWWTDWIVVLGVENVGLSLSYGLSLNSVLFWAIYMSCFIENKMVSVERIKQFSNIPSEAAWNIKDRSPPPNWPGQGHVDIKDLQVSTLVLNWLFPVIKIYILVAVIYFVNININYKLNFCQTGQISSKHSFGS